MFAHHQHSLWILFFCCVVVAFGQFWKDGPRKYVVQQDFFKGFKAAEFSIKDEDEQQLLYRIESSFNLQQRIEIFRYPEQKRTGYLRSYLRFGSYAANFSILDEKKNRWIDGEIRKHSRTPQKVYFIRWSGQQFNAATSSRNRTYEYRDENKTLLADFTPRWFSSLWMKKYDLNIHSNRYLDELYFLTIAAIDWRSTTRRRG